MIRYNVKPPKGEKFLRLDYDVWRTKAPSTYVEYTYPDKSADIRVEDCEADNLTDHWDEVGCTYEML